ncbi:GroES-like protein [Marasmius fiardii PR-910]|nr:GroES-like protein [Marasmius fiardii PR-910]
MPDQKTLLLEKKQTPLVLITRPIPKPGPGELLVKVKAAGLNPVDWKIQDLGLLMSDDDFPMVLGTDIAGDVVELGEGVDAKRWEKGTRVFFQGLYGRIDMGGFQQYALISADLAAKIPPQLSYSQAASLCVAFLCAGYAIIVEQPIGASLNPKWDRNVQFSGEHALVFGGSTSVGQYAIQILRKVLGFSTVITYASGKQAEYLKSLGATHVIDRHEVSLDDLPGAVLKLTSQSRLKMVFDTFGGGEEVGFKLLADEGQLYSSSPAWIGKPERKEGGKRLSGVLGIAHLPTHRAAGVTMMKNLEKLLEEGVIIPNKVYDLPIGLENVAEGLVMVKGEKAGGAKVIAHPED